MGTTMPEPKQMSAEEAADKVKNLIKNNDLDPAEVIDKVRGLFLSEIETELTKSQQRYDVMMELKSRLDK